MAVKDAKLDRLQAVPLFAECDRKALQRLAQSIDTVDIEPGYEIYREGHLHHEAYVIEAGTAKVLIDGEHIADIPAGEMIGEIGLLTGGTSTATVVAATPMTLLVVPHQRFNQIMEDTPGLGFTIAKELARRLQATDARLH